MAFLIRAAAEAGDPVGCLAADTPACAKEDHARLIPVQHAVELDERLAHLFLHTLD